MPGADDPHDLNRFVQAQDPEWSGIMAELEAGDKRTHWIWYVFPQVEGLGSSRNAQHYAIKSREEAVAYLQHRKLGPRLVEATRTLMRHEDKAAEDVLGTLDASKFRSSMTLFEGVAGDAPLAPKRPEFFAETLERFFGAERCEHTRRWLGGA